MGNTDIIVLEFKKRYILPDIYFFPLINSEVSLKCISSTDTFTVPLSYWKNINSLYLVSPTTEILRYYLHLVEDILLYVRNWCQKFSAFFITGDSFTLTHWGRMYISSSYHMLNQWAETCIMIKIMRNGNSNFHSVASFIADSHKQMSWCGGKNCFWMLKQLSSWGSKC